MLLTAATKTGFLNYSNGSILIPSCNVRLLCYFYCISFLQKLKQKEPRYKKGYEEIRFGQNVVASEWFWVKEENVKEWRSVW